MEIEKKIIKAMPKTDLHIHLDGSVRIPTLLELAKKQNIELPTSDFTKLKKLLVPGLRCRSLVDYLRPFDIVLSVLQEEEALSRVAFELAEDAARERTVACMQAMWPTILAIRTTAEWWHRLKYHALVSIF